MHTALEISKYIINRCISNKNPISNLQLQKILYYVQGQYIASVKKPLFGDNIEAWTYGPVVPDVYNAFRSYSSSDILDIQAAPDLEESISKRINSVIDEKSSMSAWELVNSTHSESPWKSCFESNKKNIIHLESIYEYFKDKGVIDAK